MLPPSRSSISPARSKTTFGKSRRSRTPTAPKTPQEGREEELQEVLAVKRYILEKEKKTEIIGKLSKFAAVEAKILSRNDVVNSPLYPLIDIIRTPIENDAKSLAGTIYDPKMGASIYYRQCATCKGGRECPGHNGYIDLGDPLLKTSLDPYIPITWGVIVRSLYNVVCPNPECNNIFFTEEEIKRHGFYGYKTASRIREMEKLLKTLRRKDGTVTCRQCTGTMRESKLDKNTMRLKIDGADVPNKDIYSTFAHISSSQLRLLGFNRNKPKDMLMSFVIVLPPSMRQSSARDGEESRKEFFEQEYNAIIDLVNKTKRLGRVDNSIIEDLGTRMMRIFRSDKGKAARRSGGQEVKGLRERVTGKEGDIRQKMTGKRLNHTSRGVTTGNTDLELDEIGIPPFIWKNSYEELFITPHTRNNIQKLLDENIVKYYVPRNEYFTRERFSIERIRNAGKSLKLVNGDSVLIPMRDGREVNNGRNPSIHKVSIMGLKVKRITGHSIKTHNSVTTPYNLDYDGDETHQSYPQGLMARAESRYIAFVIHNIINTENSSASMGLVMDAITTMYYMTASKEIGFKRITAEQKAYLHGFITSGDGFYRLDERLAYYKIDPLSTRGVLSALFPANFRYTSKSKDGTLVSIRDGILITGTMSKPQVGPTRNSIVQAIYNYYGESRAALFINEGMKVCDKYMRTIEGFSIGLGDTRINDPYVKSITLRSIANTRAMVNNMQAKTTGEIESQRIESEIINLIYSKTVSLGNKLTRDVLSGNENSFRPPIASGAKGDIFHAGQMVSTMGQQFEMGNRIGKDISDGKRVTFYDQIGDTDIEANGFIVNSLGDGLNARDMINHHIAKQVTLIDTTTKTVDAGDFHHLENKALLDIHVAYDGTLRDANNMIVTYLPGIVGLNPFETIYINHQEDNFPFFVDITMIVEQVNSELRW